MSSRTIRFYFDFISPNAYLAWTQLPALAEGYRFTVEPVPVLFAGLLKAHGQLGPAEIPAKARWMARNNVRKAALLRVPLNPPAYHPFNPLFALRVSSLPLGPAERSRLIGALFQAVWVRGLHVGDAATVATVADEIGLRGAALVAEADRSETKDRLRAQTDDAISRGVFGVPTMEVQDELFWGYDDFPLLELFLADKDPLDARAWEGWAGGSPASAVRARARVTKLDD